MKERRSAFYINIYQSSIAFIKLVRNHKLETKIFNFEKLLLKEIIKKLHPRITRHGVVHICFGYHISIILVLKTMSIQCHFDSSTCLGKRIFQNIEALNLHIVHFRIHLQYDRTQLLGISGYIVYRITRGVKEDWIFQNPESERGPNLLEKK